jgi:hypothetical protein
MLWKREAGICDIVYSAFNFLVHAQIDGEFDNFFETWKYRFVI